MTTHRNALIEDQLEAGAWALDSHRSFCLERKACQPSNEPSLVNFSIVRDLEGRVVRVDCAAAPDIRRVKRIQRSIRTESLDHVRISNKCTTE
jgi:hypothetical protein